MKLQSVSLRTRNPAGGEASQVLADWPCDVEFTFDAALQKHPELADRRSVLVDLAYEEYCQLEANCDKVDRQEFAARFPNFQRSLLRVLELHSFCQNDSDIRRTFFAKPWPVAGDDILGFHLIEEIGRGSASRVFLATDPDLSGRLVVIKVGRALDEAAALGKLDHPGIVPVHSARIDPATELSVLCMPYWGRGTLLQLIDRLHAGAPPQTGHELTEAAHANAGDLAAGTPSNGRAAPRRYVDAVAALGASLADALAFAHAQGIVHSDVKPSNVLITADGRPLLLDFNLARQAEADERLVGGTLPYMAPEQLAAWAEHAGPIGPASDVFSLGATLHELLTGQPPFGRIDEPDVATAAAVLTERHRRGPAAIPPQRLRGNRRLERIISACLAADPGSRPTAAELSAALAATVPHSSGLGVWRVAAMAAGVVVAATASAALLRGGVEQPPVYHGTAQTLSDADALADRGWARLSNNELQLAYEDLKAAYARDRSPRNAAALGYCVMKLTGEWNGAAKLLTEAVAGGEDTAVVQNALGYCHLKLKKLDGAQKAFASARELDSGFEAAEWNLMLVDLFRSRQNGVQPDLEPVRAFLAAEERSAVVYLDAACAFAQACATGEDAETDVIQCCEAAIARGLAPQDLEIVTTYYPDLAKRDTFRRLSRLQANSDVTFDLFSLRVPPPYPMLGERRGLEISLAGR